MSFAGLGDSLWEIVKSITDNGRRTTTQSCEARAAGEAGQASPTRLSPPQKNQALTIPVHGLTTSFPLPRVRFMIARFVRLALLSAFAIGFASVSFAKDDAQFFKSVEGKWFGPGEIVAGKYKGTKFTCTLSGTKPDGKTGISMDGQCRVGVFAQEMNAKILYSEQGYSGAFLDGAKGKGLDIVSGNVNGDRVTMALNRNKLNGAMLARMETSDLMHVSISVRVNKDMVRVIGMSLTRVDEASTGSVAKN
jgi:hypothetical protein